MTEISNNVLCSAVLPLLSIDCWFVNLMVYREILMIAMVLLFTLVCFNTTYIVTLCDVA